MNHKTITAWQRRGLGQIGTKRVISKAGFSLMVSCYTICAVIFGRSTLKAYTNNNLNLSRSMIPYTPEECYRAYLALYGIRDMFRKPAALSSAGCHIMQRYSEGWPVIGITREAVDSILGCGIETKNGAYRLSSVPKVQRAHLKNRVETWVELMQFEHTLEQFWAVYTEADKTVLCLPTQNAGIYRLDYIPVPSGLFCSQGYRARVSHSEIEWLMSNQTASAI